MLQDITTVLKAHTLTIPLSSILQIECQYKKNNSAKVRHYQVISDLVLRTAWRGSSLNDLSWFSSFSAGGEGLPWLPSATRGHLETIPMQCPGPMPSGPAPSEITYLMAQVRIKRWRPKKSPVHYKCLRVGLEVGDIYAPNIWVD